jgi:hypothetical protein
MGLIILWCDGVVSHTVTSHWLAVVTLRYFYPPFRLCYVVSVSLNRCRRILSYLDLIVCYLILSCAMLCCVVLISSWSYLVLSSVVFVSSLPLSLPFFVFVLSCLVLSCLVLFISVLPYTVFRCIFTLSLPSPPPPMPS